MEQKQIVNSLIEPMALGDIFYQSGMFSDVATQAQAVVKILAGRELGLAPLESMTNIYIVKGRVSLQAKLIAGLIKKSGRYDYTIETLNDDECVIAFYEQQQGTDGQMQKVLLGKSSFTKADAAKAGIVNKEVWKNFPRNMLFARAVSNGARWYTADVFCGYASEEIEEVETTPVAPKTISITAEGEVVNAA